MYTANFTPVNNFHFVWKNVQLDLCNIMIVHPQCELSCWCQSWSSRYAAYHKVKPDCPTHSHSVWCSDRGGIGDITVLQTPLGQLQAKWLMKGYLHLNVRHKHVNMLYMYLNYNKIINFHWFLIQSVFTHCIYYMRFWLTLFTHSWLWVYGCGTHYNLSVKFQCGVIISTFPHTPLMVQ